MVPASYRMFAERPRLFPDDFPNTICTICLLTVIIPNPLSSVPNISRMSRLISVLLHQLAVWFAQMLRQVADFKKQGSDNYLPSSYLLFVNDITVIDNSSPYFCEYEYCLYGWGFICTNLLQVYIKSKTILIGSKQILKTIGNLENVCIQNQII